MTAELPHLTRRGMVWGRCFLSAGAVFGGLLLTALGTPRLLGAVLLAALLHELGHLAAALLLEIPIRQLRITLVGAELVLGTEPHPCHRLILALAGPLVNLLLTAALLLFPDLPQSALLAGTSLILGLFNLLPIEPLDGGQCAAAALDYFGACETVRWGWRWLVRGLLGGLTAMGGWLAMRGNGSLLVVTVGLLLLRHTQSKYSASR